MVEEKQKTKVEKEKQEVIETKEQEIDKTSNKKEQKEFKTEKKKERIGILHIYTTFNNTIINLTDIDRKSVV